MKKEKKPILYRRSKGEKIVFTIFFLIFAVYAASLVLPFVWLLMSSLKSGVEFADNLSMGGNAFALPEHWLFGNYVTAFKAFNYLGVDFLGLLFNTVLYVAASIIGALLFPTILGYCLSKYRFRLRGLIYGIGIFTMTIPIVGTLGAYYKLIRMLGLYDTRAYLLLCLISTFGFNFLMMYAFFQNVSWSYAEAVFIDGGNHFTAFFRVMLPQAVAPLTVLAIMAGVGAWNEYMVMILYMPSYPTISSSLYFISDSLQRSNNMPVYYCALVLSMLPIILIYAIFAEKMMTNISIGGLKG